MLPAGADAQDLDRDGLDDGLEQRLLARFVPTFVLSAGECDGLPASFLAERADPHLRARDGTIHGHATPRGRAADGAPLVEVKFFHLWGRDCGRTPHALDAEHVSALLTAPSLDAPAGHWTSVYWYAAAHAGTVCDAGSGARAGALRAETVGPYVYVSRGKHASYLVRDHCKWGCGGDRCDPGGAIVPAAEVVNLGEAEAPLAGASWLRSTRWALAAKLESDFDPVVRARLDRPGPARVHALALDLRTVQSPILGADTGLDALLATGDAATAALAETADAAGEAIGATATAVGGALARTAAAIGWFLRLR
jgi:hypothetical protein